MGVRGLKKIFESFELVKFITFKEFKSYRGKKLAIDTMPVLYKFSIALMNIKNNKLANAELTSHLFACFFKTHASLRYGILPVWVHDGKPPEIKSDTLYERRIIKEKAHQKLISMNEDNLSEDQKMKLAKRMFSINSKQIDEVRKLLNLMGIPSIDAPGEAEAQCVALNRAGLVDGVVTEDWDVIPFGGKIMLKDFSNKNLVGEVDCIALLSALGMNSIEQMINLCCILGNDFCEGISGLKPVDAYDKFKKSNFDIVNFLNLLKKENGLKSNKNRKNIFVIPEDFIEKMNKAKKYFLDAEVINPEAFMDKIEWNEPKYNEIKEFLITQKKFDSNIINTKVDQLKLMYEFYKKNKEINNNTNNTNGNNLFTFSMIKKIINSHNEQKKYALSINDSSNNKETYFNKKNNDMKVSDNITKNSLYKYKINAHNTLNNGRGIYYIS